MTRHLLAGTALALLVAAPALAAGLDARLSATRVAEGDQVVLSLSTDAGQAAQPDLSVLDKDFTVLGTASGTQTTIVNGARSDRVTWQITLLPNHGGTLTVPPITAGSASSGPLTLSVVDASQLPPADQAGRPTITATIPDGTIHAHQEVPVTVSARLPAGTQGAEIRPPESKNILIEQSGEDSFSRQLDGSVLLERTYLLRPQSEGPVTLDGFTVTAEVADQSAPDPFAGFGRSPFGGSLFDRFFSQGPMGGSPFGSMFAPVKRVAATSAPLTLDVQATPGGTSGWALPAKGVELREIWQPDPPVFRVGEAVTRKVQVIALGAHAEQIPDITLPDLPGARVYAEGADKRSVPTQGGTAAIREFTWSVVPTSGGDLVLPEIVVEWFDTGDEAAKTAVLPAATYHVEGPVAATAAPIVHETKAAKTAVVPAGSERWLSAALVGGALAVVALLGMAAGLLVRTSRQRARMRSEAKPQTLPTAARSRAEALARAEAASRTGDRAGLHRAALDWVRASGNTVDRATLRFPALMADVSALEAELFGGAARSLRPSQLLASLRSADAAFAAPSRDRTALPPLYPVEG